VEQQSVVVENKGKVFDLKGLNQLRANVVLHVNLCYFPGGDAGLFSLYRHGERGHKFWVLCKRQALGGCVVIVIMPLMSVGKKACRVVNQALKAQRYWSVIIQTASRQVHK
jgi:hypothetical protein